MFHSERLLKSALTRWSQEKWLNVNCLLCYTLSNTEWTEVPENFSYFWSFLTLSCSSFNTHCHTMIQPLQGSLYNLFYGKTLRFL